MSEIDKGYYVILQRELVTAQAELSASQKRERALKDELSKPACTDENGTWHNPDDLRDLAGHGATIIQLSDELAACHEARNIQADTIVRLVGALKAIAGHVKGPMNNVAHLQATARAALSQVQA